MRVIADECLPNRLATALSRQGHEAILVQKAGYSGLKDGALLREIQGKFDAFIAIDGNMTYQQNLLGSRIGIVVLGALSNIFDDI